MRSAAQLDHSTCNTCIAQELSAPTAMAKRNGQWGELAIKMLVLGDLIELKGGDVIPVDCRVRKAASDCFTACSACAL